MEFPEQEEKRKPDFTNQANNHNFQQTSCLTNKKLSYMHSHPFLACLKKIVNEVLRPDWQPGDLKQKFMKMSHNYRDPQINVKKVTAPVQVKEMDSSMGWVG